MREILFRGKRTDNGEWLEGCLLKVTLGGKAAHLIFGDNFAFCGNEVKALAHALVDPETVGRYTGLTDKNGKLAFEHDILRVADETYAIYGVVRYGQKPDDRRFDIGFWVEWMADGELRWDLWWRNDIGHWLQFEDCEVVGNIHDNPELLKGEQP